MNRRELVDELAERFEGNRQVAAHALDSVVDIITRSVSAGEKVVITGFGAFERGVREAGAKSEKYVAEFRPGKELSEVVSGARKMRERVTESLAVVPEAAADVAEQAGRKAASSLRAAADRARELSDTGSTRTQPAKKSTTKRSPAKKSAAKKSTAKKSAAKKSPAKKSAAKKSAAKKSPAKKSAAKKSPAKKSPATKSAAKKQAPAKTAAPAATSSGSS